MSMDQNNQSNNPIQLSALAADPTANATSVRVYGKTVSGHIELFFQNEAGTVEQLSGAAASASFAGVSITNVTAFSNQITFGNGQQSLTYEATNSTGLRNGVNAQTFSVYNTYTAGTPDYERLELFWTSNTAIIRTGLGGTGTARALQFRYGNSTSIALQINTALSGGVLVGGTSTAATFALGLFAVGSSTYSALSGTVTLQINTATFQDGGTTSTTVAQCLQISPTVNYTAASKTGKVVLAYFNPTLTSVPSGSNAGISFSSAFTNASVPAIRFHNVADEDTNTEYFELGWHIAANNFIFRTANAGSGTARNAIWRFGGTTANAVLISTGINGGVSLNPNGSSAALTSGRVVVGQLNTVTATSGNSIDLLVNGGPAPSSTSTMTYRSLNIAPVINYSNGTPGAGSVYCAYIVPTNTALPTGLNAGLAFSSTASGLTGAIMLFNVADETTNYEYGALTFTSNVLTLSSTSGGSGTTRNINLSVQNAAASAIVTHAATSTITGAVTDGYTAGLRLTPTYTAGSALTVTRHNYIDINTPTLSGAGPAACTDAAVLRFDNVPGTHKALASDGVVAVTFTALGPTGAQTTIQGWIKINVNGTLRYVPFW